LKLAKQGTVTGAYSAEDCNDHNKDKIRNVSVGPNNEDMTQVKSYASEVDDNSGFAKPGGAGRDAGFSGPIRVGKGTVQGRVPPPAVDQGKEVKGASAEEFLSRRQVPLGVIPMAITWEKQTSSRDHTKTDSRRFAELRSHACRATYWSFSD
jgi:hypothetical protein